MGGSVSILNNYEEEFPNPKTYPSFTEAVADLKEKGFLFTERIDDAPESPNDDAPESPNDDAPESPDINVLDMEMPPGWSIFQVFRSDYMYYILDPEMKPHYFINSEEGRLDILKVEDFVENCKVSLIQEEGKVRLADAYALCGRTWSFACVPRKIFFSEASKFSFKVQTSPAETGIVGGLFTDEDLQPLLDQKKIYDEKLRQTFLKRGLDLDVCNYQEFDQLMESLSRSVDEMLRFNFEQLRTHFDFLAALPQEKRKTHERYSDFKKYHKLTSEYVSPYLEAIGPPFASMPFDEVYQFFDPYNASEMRRKCLLDAVIQARLRS